jgi:hypothetical protein
MRSQWITWWLLLCIIFSAAVFSAATLDVGNITEGLGIKTHVSQLSEQQKKIKDDFEKTKKLRFTKV